jgi:PTS system cellobiose-specific IIB component
MYRIALVCENGASTGMVVRKMQAVAEKKGITAEIKAYPYTQLENFINEYDVILFGPQLAYKLNQAKRVFSQYADKMETISPMDFGMMNGEKILNDAIKIANK